METVQAFPASLPSIGRSSDFTDEVSGFGDLLDLISTRPSWHARAECRKDHPGVTWFPENGQTAEPAKRICRTCPVQAQCLDWAMSQGSALHGVWAGTSGRQRKSALRSRHAA